MTLIMFDEEEENITIYSDTLVVDAQYRPVGYRNKVWTFPHLNLVITTTGTAEVGEAWAHQVGRLLDVRDIEDLNQIAPKWLPEIHEHVAAQAGEDIGTATIYMWGFPTGSKTMTRYTYRSPDGYQSEPSTGRGFATKPPARTFTPERPESLEDVIVLAERIRTENGDGRAKGTVPIGGELFETHVARGLTQTRRVHEFQTDQ